MMKEINITSLVGICHQQKKLSGLNWDRVRYTFSCPNVEGHIAFSTDSYGRVISISNMARGWVMGKTARNDESEIHFYLEGYFTNAEDDIAMIMMSMEADASFKLKAIAHCDTRIAMIKF